MKNLAAEPSARAALEKMRARLAQWRKETGDTIDLTTLPGAQKDGEAKTRKGEGRKKDPARKERRKAKSK